mgnify:CR=1 FL=1
MIVVMKNGATDEQIRGVVDRVRELGLKPHVIMGTERTVIAAIGDKRDEHRQSLESCPGVAEIIPILAPYKVASLEVRPDRTVVRVGPLVLGNSHVGVIAGPCSVENEEQTLATARAVKEAGAAALRGGAFKPRTSPYAFQGLKEDGLKILAAARAETGLPVVTEVITPVDVEVVAAYADVLQIGARNMQNYRLLEEVGRAGKPVLLKRGPAASAEELLLAAEYVLNTGNHDVILCERGIRTFETHTRFTLSLATVVWLHERTHLPVVVDPSHGTGHSILVGRMAAAAVAAGADGLIVEVHPTPERAMSDGYQSLTFEQFRELMALCRRIADAVGRSIDPAWQPAREPSLTQETSVIG